MKKILTLAATLMVFAASSASAAGLSLAWTNCLGSGLGTTGLTFACNSNTGGQAFIASVAVPANMDMFTASSAIFDITVDAATLPAWWQVTTGQCRANAITVSFDPAILGNFSACPDLWAGSLNLSVFQAQPGLHGPNSLRLNSGAAIPAGQEIAVVADGTELTVCRVNINRTKSAGATGCAGCATGACIVFNEAKVQQPAGLGDYTITNAMAPASNFITWQAGHSQCPLVTPSQNRTWGAVKNLYR